MSNPMQRVAEDILRTAEAQFRTFFEQRTRGLFSGGNKLNGPAIVGAIPGASIVHAIQSAVHGDVDHDTLPQNGDVLTWDAARSVWTPASVAAVGAGSPETLVIPGDPPEFVTADGDFIYVAYS